MGNDHMKSHGDTKKTLADRQREIIHKRKTVGPLLTKESAETRTIYFIITTFIILLLTLYLV